MFIFPYESIDKGSRIIIYGFGAVGREFVEQITFTAYCPIAAILDRNVEQKYEYKEISVCSPEEFDFEKNESSFRYVVVANNNENTSHEIRQYLKSKGVPENKIIEAYGRVLSEKKYLPGRKIDGKLRVAVENRGGVGDVVMDSLFLWELRNMLPADAELDYFSKPYHVMDELPFVSHMYELKDKKPYWHYDLYIDMRRIPLIHHIEEEKIQREVPALYDFVQKHRSLLQNEFLGSIQCGLYVNYARLVGRKRLDEIDLFDTFHLTPAHRRYMYIGEEAIQYYETSPVFGCKYITVNRAVDGSEPGTHPKLWSVRYYNALLRMLKTQYEYIKIVQIGGKSSERLEAADISLVGRTTLEEVKAILKYGLFHIDIEGGLVHLNNFLYGRSVVICGPTLEDYYGYPENLNISVHEPCKSGCEGVTEFWAKRCALGEDEAPCMRAVTPEYVFGQICGNPDLWNPEKTVTTIRVDHYSDIKEKVEIDLIHKKIAVIGTGRLPFGVEADNPILIMSIDGKVACVEYINRFNLPMYDGEFELIIWMLSLQERYKDYIERELIRAVCPGGTIYYVGEQNE